MEYTGTFEPNGVSEEEAAEILGEAYAAVLEGLEQLDKD